MKMTGQTAYDHAVDFFKNRVVQRKEGLEELKKHDRTVQFNVLNEGSFVMSIKGGQVTFDKVVRGKSDIEVESDSQTFISLFKGEITPSKAFLDGKLLALRGWVDKTKPYFPWLTKIIRIGQGR